MSIEIRNISKMFDEFQALDNVSIDIPNGKLTALLGPSGSGKSTLLRIVAGLETADSGDVLIEGRRATALPPQQRNVGFVFQHYAPFRHMTVWDNVAFGLKIRRRPRKEIADRVNELLALVQLTGWARHYPSQLSGGQKQRMALARALVVQPKVLLLDEPFGALDARVRSELREWLTRLHSDIGITTVLVTHDQEEAMEVADQLVVMDAGRVQQAGSPLELYDNPQSHFVMSFLGNANELNGSLVRPHDVSIYETFRPGTHEAMVRKLVYFGFGVRVHLFLDDGRQVRAELSRDEASYLSLVEGKIVFVDLSRCRDFEAQLIDGQTVYST